MFKDNLIWCADDMVSHMQTLKLRMDFIIN